MSSLPQSTKELPYTWTQTPTELTVIVPLAPGTRANALHVQLNSTSLAVAYRSAPGAGPGASTPLIPLDTFYKPIIMDESTWTVVNSELQLTLVKTRSGLGEWWPHVLQRDPKIDTTALQPEPTSDLSGLDGETRAMVEKMMYDQRAKQMSTASSQQRSLEEFQKKHPEMDFSLLKK